MTNEALALWLPGWALIDVPVWYGVSGSRLAIVEAISSHALTRPRWRKVLLVYHLLPLVTTGCTNRIKNKIQRGCQAVSVMIGPNTFSRERNYDGYGFRLASCDGRLERVTKGSVGDDAGKIRCPAMIVCFIWRCVFKGGQLSCYRLCFLPMARH